MPGSVVKEALGFEHLLVAGEGERLEEELLVAHDEVLWLLPEADGTTDVSRYSPAPVALLRAVSHVRVRYEDNPLCR